MLNRERFFPGFNHILCGNPPKSALAQLKEKLAGLKQSSLSEISDLFCSLVPLDKLQPKASKANSRERIYSLNVTFWAFLHQVINPRTSCREVVRRVQGFCSLHQLEMPSSETTAYCKARKRLPIEDLNSIHESVVNKVQGRVRDEQRWMGHDIKVMDGTGITLADTPLNQKDFPQPSSQLPGCGFPVMKMVACFCLSSGALLKWVETSLKSHESRILQQFLGFFGSNDVVLTDRGFTSYSNIGLLMQQGVNLVMRAHQARKVDYRTGEWLGRYDRLMTWVKPQRQKGWTKEDWAALPNTMQLRVVRIFIAVKGFRVRQYDLVTTLTDHEIYTVDDLADLYYQRWAVELFFRHIKTTMGMEVLRCKKPDMVRKELQMFIIAYNLIRTLMQEAAAQYPSDLHRLSFKATVDTLRDFRIALAATSNQPKNFRRITDEMLRVIASETVPLRMNRSEPRALKKRPKPFQRLMCHRSKFKVSKSRKNKGKPKPKNVAKTA
jgi:hypothetical protein